jgi:hypothetical protein
LRTDFEHALDFERIAAEETDSKVKAALEKQAVAYRELAVERMTKLGLPEVEAPEKSN